MEVVKWNDCAPDANFKWRDRFGTMTHPSEMDTHHVFHTMMMIWNHAVPERYSVNFKHRYEFSAFYTTKYMVTAFRAMYEELQKRSDITLAMKSTCETLERYIREHFISEYSPKQIN